MWIKMWGEPARFQAGTELWYLLVLQLKPRVSLWWHLISIYNVYSQCWHKEHPWSQKHWQEIWSGHKTTYSGPGPLHKGKIQLPRWGINCKPSAFKASPTYFEGEEDNISQVNHKHWKSRKEGSKVVSHTQALCIISGLLWGMGGTLRFRGITLGTFFCTVSLSEGSVWDSEIWCFSSSQVQQLRELFFPVAHK